MIQNMGDTAKSPPFLKKTLRGTSKLHRRKKLSGLSMTLELNKPPNKAMEELGEKYTLKSLLHTPKVNKRASRFLLQSGHFVCGIL